VGGNAPDNNRRLRAREDGGPPKLQAAAKQAVADARLYGGSSTAQDTAAKRSQGDAAGRTRW